VLLSIHRRFEELDARSVGVLLGGRRFTIQPPDDERIDVKLAPLLPFTLSSVER
jgi:hypothetical protein